MQPTRLWLIGLMASGKTTIGLMISALWGCEYVDNDAAIAALAGTSTVALADRGGTVLHDWESRYARALGERPTPVVAGVPASCADRPDDLAALTASGRLIYLRADADTLATRVRADGPRPWFHGDPEPLLRRMFLARDAILLGTAETVDATPLPPAVVDAVLGLP